MLIEVTGTSIHNKGAELMLLAVREHYALSGDVAIAVDQHFGPYAARAKYGLLQMASYHGMNRTRLGLSLLPATMRSAFGVVLEKDLDVVLDASGFAFGDQHPLKRLTAFVDRIERAKDDGKTIVLLPQALGPFRQSAHREAFARLMHLADLVFARDWNSHRFAQDAAGEHDHLRVAPDFTNLVQPTLHGKSEDSDRVCIVPNQRMIEKASSVEAGERYLPLLKHAIDAVWEAALHPVLLVHGADDLPLAHQVQSACGPAVEIHQEPDPLELKRYLGESFAVIGSRFHALVSALSQGVPTIGTSWSHKYEMLFEDYGCQEMLLTSDASAEDVRRVVRRLSGASRDELRHTLQERSHCLKNAAREMWRQVDDVIGLSPVQAPVLDLAAVAV